MGRTSSNFSKGKVSISVLIFISEAIFKNSLPSSLDIWAKDFDPWEYKGGVI
jgi:hypothetical protein